jgi:hypothetical protein
MERETYLQDLKEIRNIMDRSSRFISLSGLSGVSAGIIALAGAAFAYMYLYTSEDYSGYRMVVLSGEIITKLIALGLIMFALAIGSAFYFTQINAKKKQAKLWDKSTKNLVINLLIPLGTGGILTLIFLLRGYIGLVAPFMLIFYGLGLINASKYSFDELRSLGILEIVLGLTATVFIGYGILFWAVGFGVLHIVYGLLMHYKYDR